MPLRRVRARHPSSNFQPVGEFELPEYELQRLSFPPLLLIMEYLIRENYSELIISTPGPVGLSALYAARNSRSSRHRHLPYRFSAIRAYPH